jgi:hypothetical protein
VTFRYGIIITAAVIILVYGVLKPERNWDMVAYVAAAYHKDGYRGADLTKQTYGEIKKEVSDKRFSLLTTGEYRETVFRDPSSLEQQLPFYSIRFAYIELIRLFKNLGLSYTKSTYVISAIFASLAVLVLGLIVLETAVPIALLPIAVAVTGYTEVARLSTPDAMACFFSLLGIYSLIRRGNLLFFIAATLPLIRTDFVLLSALLMAVTYFRGNRLVSLISLVSAVILYLSVTQLNGNYGYLTLFNFTFIGSLTPYPADIVLSSNLVDYLKPYAKLLDSLIAHPHAVIYVLAFYLLWLKREKVGDKSMFLPLCGVPVVFTLAHMLLFPTDQYRFFVFSASLMLIWSLSLITQVTRSSAS